jgi:uncharacterized protein (TIGR03067 family)
LLDRAGRGGEDWRSGGLLSGLKNFRRLPFRPDRNETNMALVWSEGVFMPRLSLAVAVILFGYVVVAQDNATEKDLKSFQGTWKIVSLRQGGRELAQGKGEHATAVISGNEITFFGKEDMLKARLKARFKLDARKKPTTIDLGDAKEKGFPNKGIYELKGDMLSLCWGGDGQPRPSKLTSTKEGDERLLVLQHVKK